MTEDKKIAILYDHYKDTFKNQKESLKRRNNYTLVCLGLITTLSFQIADPTQIDYITNAVIKEKVGDINIDINYVNDILLFSLLWIVIMYYQINILIDRMYNYLQNIEMELTTPLAPFKISREGKTYLDNYPWLSEVVDRIYSILFPVTLISVAFIKWFAEKDQSLLYWQNGHFWFDTIFLLGIVLTSLLYLINKHYSDFRKTTRRTKIPANKTA